MKLIYLWVMWLVVVLGQMIAGNWYYQSGFGPLINCLLTFGCAYSVWHCYRGKTWATAYCLIGGLQILLNYADIAGIVNESDFDGIALALNTAEFVVLFLFGGKTTMEAWHVSNNGDSGASDSHRVDCR